jgi:biopolymer transport protein ExbD
VTSAVMSILEEEVPVRKRRPPRSAVGMLNIVPMLDILFNLLILFLCFGLALAPEGALPAKLPGSHGQAAGTMPLTPIEIRLIGDAGAVRVQMRPQGLQLSNMGDVYTQMKMLVESRDFGADAPVILVPGPDVPMAVVADAYNAAFQAGFKEIVFGDKVDEGTKADGQR